MNEEKEEEIIASNVCDHEGDNKFDAMIGALQDILMHAFVLREKRNRSIPFQMILKWFGNRVSVKNRCT